MLNYMLIRHKKIFECFSCFWKVFYFENFQKFQKLCNPILATVLHRLSKSQAPNCEFTQKLLVTLQRVKAPVMKNTQKIFKNLGFLDFCDSVWQVIREWKLQSRGLLRMFGDSRRDLLVSGPSSREKHLDNFFFKFYHTGFWRLALATCS